MDDRSETPKQRHQRLAKAYERLACDAVRPDTRKTYELMAQAEQAAAHALDS